MTSWQRACYDTHVILFIDPKGGYTRSELTAYFGTVSSQLIINDNVAMTNIEGSLLVRDDVVALSALTNGTRVLVSARFPKVEGTVPLILNRNNVVWMNSLNTNEIILSQAFEAFYNKPMRTSIMYGEGLYSQNLVITTRNQTKRNHFQRFSINGAWRIPRDIDWLKLPPDVDIKDSKFLFGLRHSLH